MPALVDCGDHVARARDQVARCQAALDRWLLAHLSDVMDARDCSRAAALRVVQSRIAYKKLSNRVERARAILELAIDAYARRDAAGEGGVE